MLINAQFLPESIYMEVLDLVGSEHRAAKLQVTTGRFPDSGPRVRNFCIVEPRSEGFGKRIKNDLTKNYFEAFKKDLLELHITNRLKLLQENEKDMHDIIIV